MAPTDQRPFSGSDRSSAGDMASHCLGACRASKGLSQFDAVNLDIVTLNETYALVIVGGKTAILKETPHEPGGYTLLSHSAFQHWFANRHVLYNDKRMSLSKYWMSHPDRRHYEGLVFTPGRDVPGYYNLWRGFAVEPAEGIVRNFLPISWTTSARAIRAYLIG